MACFNFLHSAEESLLEVTGASLVVPLTLLEESDSSKCSMLPIAPDAIPAICLDLHEAEGLDFVPWADFGAMDVLREKVSIFERMKETFRRIRVSKRKKSGLRE